MTAVATTAVVAPDSLAAERDSQVAAADHQAEPEVEVRQAAESSQRDLRT